MYRETTLSFPKQLSWTSLRSWKGALLFTALTAFGAHLAIHIPPTPVPITLQVFAVLLSGLILGARWGFVAQAQYVALGACGVPIFAFGNSGLSGPSAGYLLAFPLAAWLIGWLTQKRECSGLQQLAACGLGIAVIYGSGCTWLALYAHLSAHQAFLAGAAWFLPFDAAKAGLAVALSRLWRAAGD